MVRSTTAIVVGYLVSTVLILAFTVLSAPWVASQEPAQFYSLVNLGVSLLAVVAGAYVTAVIASRAHMLHALVLGAIYFLGGAIYQIQRLLSEAAPMSAGPEPLWYLILLPVLALPACWLGARLRLWQVGNERSDEADDPSAVATA